MKVLITSGKSALAFKMVRLFETEQIVLADYGNMPQFPSKEYNFISLGEMNIDIAAHTLLKSCLDNAADAILPLLDFEVEALSKSAVLFKEFGIQVLHADRENFGLQR